VWWNLTEYGRRDKLFHDQSEDTAFCPIGTRVNAIYIGNVIQRQDIQKHSF
jgi:hypothetical protein